MTDRRAASLVVVIVALAATVSGGQSSAKRNPAFNPADYPKSEFLVTQTVHTFGAVKIRIIHAKRRKEVETPPSFCRAWVDITRGESLLRRLFYNDFEPVGYSYGVFVPAKQPSPDYFVLVKEGDYDGHLLLVNGSGKITDTLGGRFFVTADRRFLVSEYASDLAGLAVYDLAQGRLILHSTDVAPVQNWYQDREGYFFTESEWSGNSGEAHEKPDLAYGLDLKHVKIIKSSLSPQRLKSASPVKYDFDPRQYDDCTSH
jgi:hypothetical protein